MLFRKYFDGSTAGSAAKSKPYGSGGSRNNPGEPSTQMDTLSPTGRTSVVAGKWKRLEDENSSSRHIMQETTVYIETESLSDDDKHHRMV